MSRLNIVAIATACLTLAAAARAQEPAPAVPAPAALPSAPQNPNPTRVVLLPVFADGVDPKAADAITQKLRATLVADGYDVVFDGGMAPARATSPVDLWNATHLSQAQIGVTATLRADQGAYVVEVVVADASGRGPFSGMARSDATALRQATEETLRGALRRRDDPNAAPSPPVPPPAQPAPPPPVAAAPMPPPVMAGPPGADRPTPAPEEPFSPLHLAFQTEGAFGLSGDGFYTHLVGARLDYRVLRNLAIGGYLGYANLKGQDGRASNGLGYAQLEYRVPLNSKRSFEMPLRFASGYLPKNGPVLRLAAGLAVRVSDDVDLVFDLLTPMLWVSGDQAVASLNVGAELGYTLPR
jgi:hypothetical protein